MLRKLMCTGEGGCRASGRAQVGTFWASENQSITKARARAASTQELPFQMNLKARGHSLGGGGIMETELQAKEPFPKASRLSGYHNYY